MHPRPDRLAMEISVLVFLCNAGDHCAPMDTAPAPSLVLHARSRHVQYGKNGLFVSDGGLTVHGIQLADDAIADFDAFDYDFRYFNRNQREAMAQANACLQDLLNKWKPGHAMHAENLVPMILGVQGAAHLQLYHYVQQGEAGALFLSYHRGIFQKNSSWGELVSLLKSARPRLTKAWPQLNDDCWYTKWRPDIEMERKFSFEGLPDTWALINLLYDEILGQRMTGFVPELDREFQVFDYESHLFEVSGDPKEAGYISFIPQADGRMTLKRKWFVENAEIRREAVTANLDIGFHQMASHAASMTPATIRQMPTFRRKRFDVNFESLRTGNIYGVYFDICRTRSPEHSFAQCEVEYCRSRTFAPFHDVVEEFEIAAAYTRDFLERQGVRFRHDTFSKLDFVRQASQMLIAERAK